MKRFGHHAAPADTKYCTHATCRTDNATELAWMAFTLQREDLLTAAIESPKATVRCRHTPRHGPIRAPFPPTQIHPQEKP